MIELSDNLYKLVTDYYNNTTSIKLNRENISYEHLINIKELKIKKEDVAFLKYFSGLESLEINSFPSITDEELRKILLSCPNLTKIFISEQAALMEVDLSGFSNLKEINIISCMNLKKIFGLENIDLSKLVFYDNKSFENYDCLFEYIVNRHNIYCEFDVSQYFDLCRYLFEKKLDLNCLTTIKWIEYLGLRKKAYYMYDKDELDGIRDIVLNIISKYIFKNDSEIEKFGILYRWIVKNIVFVNEDDCTDGNLKNNIYESLCTLSGGRLTYAKVFQMFLSAVGIRSSIVYSLGALDDIGKFNGEQVYSLVGLSDYALLRVSLNDRYYYLDIAWDSLVYKNKYYDALRLFLVSKEELMLRHRLVGEGNILKSYSYHGDDSDDLNVFSESRIQYVDAMFNKIRMYDANIDGIMTNISFCTNELNTLKENCLTLKENDNDNIIKLNHELEFQEKELLRYVLMRKDIIINYNDSLRTHYLGNYESGSVLILLENEKKYHLISDEIFNLLKIVLN